MTFYFSFCAIVFLMSIYQHNLARKSRNVSERFFTGTAVGYRLKRIRIRDVVFHLAVSLIPIVNVIAFLFVSGVLFAHLRHKFLN